MWFNHLPKEDKNYLIEAFNQDGFKVNQRDDTLIAEKSGQKIILANLTQAKLILDFKKWLKKHELLATQIGAIPFSVILDHLQNETRIKESKLDCLKNVAMKYNWSVLYSGSTETEPELAPLFGESVRYIELETDEGQMFTFIAFQLSEEKPEKVYAINHRFVQLYKLMEAFDKREEFRGLAPHAFLALQALGQY